MGAQSCSVQENKVTKKVTKGSTLNLGPASRTLLKLPPILPSFRPSPAPHLLPPPLFPEGLSEQARERRICHAQGDSIKAIPKGA